jgi:hypothetical protein
MTDYLREYLTRIRPPRPPPGVGQNLKFEMPEQSDEFQRILWRKALARAIREARREARSRHDPALKAKLRHLYQTLWGGRKGMAGTASESADAQISGEQRKAHD